MKVIFMSGYTDKTASETGILLEKDHFLQKPFTGTALAKAVREALDSPHHPR